MDRYLDSLERVERARVELAAALDELPVGIERAVTSVAGGVHVSDVVRDTRLRIRRRLSAALSEMGAALAENRVEAIRVMVDDEGMSMAAVARLFDVPRQVVSRLYHGKD